MESRKHLKKPGGRLNPSSELPHEFIQMVKDVYNTNFAEGLKAVEKVAEAKPYFEARGMIYADEIVLGVSLCIEKQLAATTVYCSVDFDPKASAPKAEDLLAVCVDAVGAFFDQFMDPKRKELLEQLAAGTLSAFGDDVPYEWTKLEFEKQRVWMKVDKANPQLETDADAFLAKHDPEFREEEDELEEEAKEMFFTGPKGTKKKPGGGQLH